MIFLRSCNESHCLRSKDTHCYNKIEIHGYVHRIFWISMLEVSISNRRPHSGSSHWGFRGFPRSFKAIIYIEHQIHSPQFLPKYFRINRCPTRWRSWLRYCATSQKVAGSIPDSIIRIFYWHNPSGRTMILGLTQRLTEISTRNISLG
jgi:hypothetical protein